MKMTRWKVWFRNEPLDEPPHDEVEFAIEFRVPEGRSYEPYPYDLIQDAARDLSEKLGLSMTGDVDNMDEV